MTKGLDGQGQKYTLQSFTEAITRLENEEAGNRLDFMKRFWKGESFERVFGIDLERVAVDCKGHHRDIVALFTKPGAVKGLGNPYMTVFLSEFLQFMNPDEVPYDEVLDIVLKSGYGLSINRATTTNFFRDEVVEQAPFQGTLDASNTRPVSVHELEFRDYAATIAALPRQLHQSELLRSIALKKGELTVKMAHSIIGHMVSAYYEHGRSYFITNISDIEDAIITSGQATAFMQLVRGRVDEKHLDFLKKIGFNYARIVAALPPIDRAYFMVHIPQLFPGREQEIADLCVEHRVHSSLVEQLMRGDLKIANPKAIIARMQDIERGVEARRGERYEKEGWGLGGDTFLSSLVPPTWDSSAVSQSEVFDEIVHRRKGYAAIFVRNADKFTELKQGDVVRAAKQAIAEGDGSVVLEHIAKLPRQIRRGLLLEGGGAGALLQGLKRGEVLVDAEVAEQILMMYEADKNEHTRESASYLASHLHMLDGLTDAERTTFARRLVREGFSREIFSGFLQHLDKEKIIAFLVESEAWQGLAVFPAARKEKLQYAEQIAQAFELPVPFVQRMLHEQIGRSHLFFERFLSCNEHYRVLYRAALRDNPHMYVDQDILSRFEGNERIERELRAHKIDVHAWHAGLEYDESAIQGSSSDELVETIAEIQESSDIYKGLIRGEGALWDSMTAFLDGSSQLTFEDPKILSDVQKVSQQIALFHDLRKAGQLDAGKEKVLPQIEAQLRQLQGKLVQSCNREIRFVEQDLRTRLGTLSRSLATHKVLYEEWHEKRSALFAEHEGGALQPEEEAVRESEWKSWLAEFTPKLHAYIRAHIRVLESIQIPLKRMEVIMNSLRGGHSADSVQPYISAISETTQHVQSIAIQSKLLVEKPDTIPRKVYTRTSRKDLVVDIFDGNNTVCCLSVDNKVHADGIPILDYMLDSGMHILQLGEVKGSSRPKYCAWLWIGKNTTTGEVALVIDNIEGAPDFAASYRTEVRELILNRSKELARKAGIQKVVLGVINNDVSIEGLEKVDGVYEKLGGFVHEQMVGGKKRPRGIMHLEAYQRKVVSVN